MPVPTRHRVAEFLDEPNEFLVLRAVRDASLISRTEIAQLCGMSKPTVSEIVNRFLGEGLLTRAGESKSTDRGGRRRELLRFNPAAGCVIGIDIRMTRCVVALSDLNATAVCRQSFEYAPGTSPDHVLGNALRLVDEVLAAAGQTRDTCVGIGVGLPGLIDPVDGVVRVADTLAGWNDVNLRAFFTRSTGIPLSVENDVKSRALGEFLFGAGKGKSDQVFLWVGDGIGAGIIVRGQLYRGVTQSAGEIGYNPLPGGEAARAAFPMLYDGQRDFGEILSTASLTSRYARHTGLEGAVTLEMLLRNAEEGETVARRMLDEAAEVLSIVCINLVNTLNPEVIVIGGTLAEASPALLDAIRRNVQEDILPAPAEAVAIRPSALKEDGVIMGAVGSVLYDLFRPGVAIRNGGARRVALRSTPNSHAVPT